MAGTRPLVRVPLLNSSHFPACLPSPQGVKKVNVKGAGKEWLPACSNAGSGLRGKKRRGGGEKKAVRREGGRRGVRWGREGKRKRLWRTRNKGGEGEGIHSDTEAQGCPISQDSGHLWARRSGLILGGSKSPFATQQQASPSQKGPRASHCYSQKCCVSVLWLQGRLIAAQASHLTPWSLSVPIYKTVAKAYLESHI